MNANLLLIALLVVTPASAESFRSWAARAAREQREKDDTSALRSYSNAISSWKESDGKAARAKAFCARGALREKAGEDAEALKDYGECLAVDKKNAKVFHTRGLLRMKAGSVTLAIDDFYQAVKADMRFGQAYADRARAYELQGEKVFAREDHQRACELGVKDSCARTKGLAPAKRRPSKKPAPAPPAADAEQPAAPPRSGPHRFKDCLRTLERCAESGRSFGHCVTTAAACEKDPAHGCCPQACQSAYRKALDRGASEAQAYREVFVPGASCAAAPKDEDADEDANP